MPEYPTTMNILGQEITVSNEQLDPQVLKFYEKNPRVLSRLKRDGKQGCDVGKADRQTIIKELMQEEISVQKLLKSIPKAGGLMEPLIVQQSTNVVIEGNSRLAALLQLSEENDNEVDRYRSVPCQLVRLNDEHIDALLDQLHIEGKTSWTAYDKAYASYQRVVEDNVDIDEYSTRISATKSEIQKRIDIVRLMMGEGMDHQPDRFSYYEQIVRSSKLRTALLSTHNGDKLKSYLLSEIKKDEPSFTSTEMRDDIPQIAGKHKLLNKLIDGTYDIETAKMYARPSTPKKHIAKAIKFLKDVNKKDIAQLDANDRNTVRIEVKRCRKEIERIYEILKST